MPKQYRIENPVLVSICRVFGADIESIERIKDGRILNGESLAVALSQLPEIETQIPEKTVQNIEIPPAEPQETGQLSLFVSR